MNASVVDIVGAALGLCTPWLSADSSTIVMSLIATRGAFASADRFARRMGARNRHQMAYYLRRDGLPPLERLSAWIRVMCWVVEYETSGTTICEWSLHRGQDPAGWYRLVQRLTGYPWTTVRTLGLAWVLEEFLKTCRTEDRRRESKLSAAAQAS
jgi:hypothetical protein